jgi:hypothetical protein
MDENTITTVFKADISQFSSSTQQLNQYIKTVNSEFDVATSSLGKWSDSTDGLTAKITQLNKVLEAEKMKLSDMKKRLEEMEAAGKGNTKEAKNLQIAINQQTAKIGKAEKQTEDYSASLKELTDAGVKTKQELDELTKAQEKQGNSAEGIASKITKGIGGAALGVAGIVTGAAGSLLGLAEGTREFRKEQSKLETAFATNGISAATMKNTYSELNAVLGDTGKTTEAMQLMSNFAKSEEELADYTNILTGVYAQFGDSISSEGLAESIGHTIKMSGEAAGVQGNLADALEWSGVNVDDFNKKLQACSTEEERSALISKQLNELYGEQAEHYKENNKDILESEKAQIRLTQATAELGAIAEPIMTALKNAFAGLLETIKPFVELIGTGLKDAFSGSSEGAKQFAEGISGIVSTLLQKATEMLPSIINIIVELIPSIIQTIVDSLPTIIETIVQCISQILNAISEMLPTLIPIVIDAILMIVQTLLDNVDQLIDAGIQLLMGLADGLIAAIPKLIEKIPVIIESLLGAISRNLPKLIVAGIELTIKLSEGLIKAIPQLVAKLPEIIAAIVKGLIEGIPELIKAGGDMLAGIFEGFIDFDAIWKKIKEFGNSIVDGVKKFFGINSPSKLFEDEIGSNLALGIGEGFTDEMGNVTKDMQKSLDKMNNSLEIDNSGVVNLGNSTTPAWVEKLFDMIRTQNVVNNYNFDYKFEKMETSKLALHKAALQTKRAIGG